MGCPCENTGNGVYIPPQLPVDVNCPYTLEQLQSWQSILLCAREKELMSTSQLNADLGIVVSAINQSWNYCYFKKNLDLISPRIIQITNTGQCQ